MAGTLTWAIPGTQREIERDEIPAVKIFTAESQTEVRVAWANAPRYVYRFRIIGRTTVGTPNEVAVLRTFYENQKGDWDTFSMADPLDGTTVTARFNGPMKMRRILPTWWELTFECVTIVNPT
jgi:hypothetical protein